MRTLASIVESRVYLHNRHWQCTTIGISNEACRRSLIHYCARHKKIKSLSARPHRHLGKIALINYFAICLNTTSASAHPTQREKNNEECISHRAFLLQPFSICGDTYKYKWVCFLLNCSLAVSDKRDVQLSALSTMVRSWIIAHSADLHFDK